MIKVITINKTDMQKKLLLILALLCAVAQGAIR